MAQLAIEGHTQRGSEVIALLEMLGGVNTHNLYGDKNYAYYTIDSDNEIKGGIYVFGDEDLLTFTIEEFLEKYPYKLGDKVRIPDYESEILISSMRWDGYNVQYEVVTDEVEWYSTTELNDFNNAKNSKEEIVDTGCCFMPTKPPMYKLNIEKRKDTNKVIFDTNSQCCDISNKIIKKETMEKEISGAIVDRFICLEGYDFYDDKGNIIDTKEITMKKKKPKYPKIYEECCKVLQMPKDESYIDIDVPLSYNKVLKAFTQLLICRDAYWKLLGNWKPNFNNYAEKFVIANCYGKVYSISSTNYNRVLVFPTEVIRDAFYENFKELIEECKELL